MVLSRRHKAQDKLLPPASHSACCVYTCHLSGYVLLITICLSVCLLQSKMDQVKGVMTENIEKVMKRGEGLDDLTERSELLSNNSTKFHRNATKLRRKLWWKNFKLWACCLLVVLIILGIVVAIIALAATGKLKK